MKPQEIVDQPIPLLEGGKTTPTGNASNPVLAGSDAFVPATHVDTAFPEVIIARDTVAQSLNTETKTILAEYTFEQLGAITIGQYVSGVSGNIKISPNGLVATNVNGITTIAIDGATGNVTIIGTLQAGSVVSGDITVGGTNNGSGQIHVLDSSNVQKVLIDKDGLVVSTGKIVIQNASNVVTVDSLGITSSALNSSINSSNASVNQSFTTGTEADITGSQLADLVLTRSAWVLVLGKATCYASTLDAGNNANLTVKLLNNGSEIERMTYGGNAGAFDKNLRTMSGHRVILLAAGTYTFKMSAIMESITGSPTMLVYGFRLSYIVIGT